jgi:hypothetical protein
VLVEGTFLRTFDRRLRWRLHAAYEMIATLGNKFATQLWDLVTSTWFSYETTHHFPESRVNVIRGFCGEARCSRRMLTGYLFSCLRCASSPMHALIAASPVYHLNSDARGPTPFLSRYRPLRSRGRSAGSLNSGATPRGTAPTRTRRASLTDQAAGHAAGHHR